MEEVTASPKDLSQIVKGKRTKRQRPQSPIPFTIPTHSSSGDGDYGSNGDGDCTDNNNNASSISDDEFLRTTTEEDENMAKCLILLAQGHHLREGSNKIDQDQNFGNDHKFTSKRYIENPISANGKARMYVYECKTCGRTFPSFQALGGHRASHKKPKNMAAEEIRMFLASSDDEEEAFKNNNNGNRNRRISSLTLELGSRGMYSNVNTGSSKSSTPTLKVHECSYCGAEFTSGQALGGHMRRHRGSTVSITTNTTLSLSPISPRSTDQETDESEAKRSRYGLSLDLNLPAPESDHHRDSIAFVSKQPNQQPQKEKQEQEKQRALVLSTRRLIDCPN